MRSLVLLLCLWEVPATAQINVPDHLDPYQPIVAGCQCIVPQNGKAQFMWEADGNSKYIPSDDGTKLYIWAPPGNHSVNVLVIVQSFKDVQVVVVDPADPNNKDKWTFKTISVVDSFDVQRYSKNYTVGDTPPPGPTPGPTPNPTPTPTPTPTPDDFTALAQKWLKDIPPASYSKDLALAIADNYSSVASQAVATSGWDLNAFVSHTKALNTAKLSDPQKLQDWLNHFFVPLAQYQQTQFDARHLQPTDTAGLAQLWRDKAAAIKGAAF